MFRSDLVDGVDIDADEMGYVAVDSRREAHDSCDPLYELEFVQGYRYCLLMTHAVAAVVAVIAAADGDCVGAAAIAIATAATDEKDAASPGRKTPSKKPKWHADMLCEVGREKRERENRRDKGRESATGSGEGD